ncbi:cysteine proteinase [Serendipita vermifera]|nr:cysteine proteinase [Serendipita vermifera]
MTFVQNSDINASTTPDLEERPSALPKPFATTSSQPQIGKPMLPPFAPVIFVEAKESSLSTELGADKYVPINVPAEDAETKQSTPQKKVETQGSVEDSKGKSPGGSPSKQQQSEKIVPLDTFKLSQKWMLPGRTFQGLYNLGNSCFMNTTLQVLIHTPPLLNIVFREHAKAHCELAKSERFCFMCALKDLILQMIASKHHQAKSPINIFNNIRSIAPSFRRGRQEDAHEFLRFSIDALQLSAQNGVKDVPQKLAETSWVHRLFGGQFRSRVHCSECGHNSDTFDTLLDLSVDVGNCGSLATALRKFAVVERLEGKNKYKCEKCNKPVNALKQITVHKAPEALCIQLKRFTPWGRKLTHPVAYSSNLSLQDVMSEEQISPEYTLYGIIVHAGSTPNSGHYYAYIKNTAGRWTRVNDDDVDLIKAPPLEHKNAYMLFYMRQHSLHDSIAQATAASKTSLDSMPRLKRKRNLIDSDDEEDIGESIPEPSNSPSHIPKTPTSLPEEPSNPSPMKKQKQTLSGEAQTKGSTSFKSLLSQYSFTDSDHKTPHRIAVLGKTNSRDTSPEEVLLSSSAPLSVPFSQSTSPPSSVLPASHTSSPVGTPTKKPRPWEVEDDPELDNPFTGSLSKENDIETMEDEEPDDSEGMQPTSLKLNGRSSDDDVARPWTSSRSGLSKSSNLQKQFRSKAKKERRNKVLNPLGFSNGMHSELKRSSMSGVSMGVNKKHRRPGI